MTSIHKKHQILESLDNLDPVQTDKVLDYIKGLQVPVKGEVGYQRFKREAMKEIRQALVKNRKLNLAF